MAFRNPDGSLAVVVMHTTAKAQQYGLSIDRKQVAVDIPAHAIQAVLR